MQISEVTFPNTQFSCPAFVRGIFPVPPTSHFPFKLMFFGVISFWLPCHFVPNCPPLFPACAAWVVPSLCSLCSSQFNHFSHFKMTLPQFYRSSHLSLPVSTATMLPSNLVASLLTFEPPDLTSTHLIAAEASFTACVRHAVLKPLIGQSPSFSPHNATAGSAVNLNFCACVISSMSNRQCKLNIWPIKNKWAKLCFYKNKVRLVQERSRLNFNWWCMNR